MPREIGAALSVSLREEMEERGLTELDPEDREFSRLLQGLSSPEKIVEAFIEGSWDLPAFIKVIDRSYKRGLVTQDQYIRLAGLGQLKSREFDT